MRPKPCFLAVLVVLMLACRTAPAAACTCVQDPHNCGNARAAAAIFEGTVVTIDEEPGPAADRSARRELHVRLRDVRALRGASQDMVVTSLDEDDCSYRFVKGARYVIVADARESDHLLTVGLCGLTRPLDQAAGFVDYVKSLAAPPSGSQVWGNVWMPAHWVEFSPSEEPLANARVTLTGPVRRSTTTAADGHFRVTGLPPGTYQVRVDLARAFPYLSPVEDAAVPLDRQHRCAAFDFTVASRSHITGVVVDEHTRPQAGISLIVRPADADNSTSGGPKRRVKTDEDGRYIFSDLPPGRYVVGVSEPFSQAAARTEFGESIVALERGTHVTMETLWIIVPLVVNEPTSLPEGTEVELLPLDPGDWLDDEDRAALHAALAQSASDVKAGRLIDVADVLKGLRSR
jgi:protocatechuate 3,4-dioxygenase beta subunit